MLILPYKTLLFTTCFTLTIFITSCTHPKSADIVSLNQIKLDKACGPRCLWAFMQITGKGESDCDINCIYGIIGKKPYSITSLKDLKNAAEKLGFSATGYQLEIGDLEEMHSYAILPIGNASGTQEDPLHFLLVKQVKSNYLIIINNQSLKPETLNVSELQKVWKGYALVISTGEKKLKGL